MWLLPSLGRVDRCLRLADSYVATGADAPVVLRLHEGFEEPYLRESWPKEWTVAVGPKTTAPGAMAELFRAQPDAECYGFLGDDVVLRTRGWDQALEMAAGRWGVAWPDDGHQEQGQNCTHACLGGDLVRAVGWWALPGVKHSYVDSAYFLIGHELALLRYVPMVKFEHRNWMFGEGPQDELTRFVRDTFEGDTRRFKKWMQKGLPETVERVRRKMDGGARQSGGERPEWRNVEGRLRYESGADGGAPLFG